MDAIDEAFATGIIDHRLLSDPMRHALTIGKRTLNKYYSLTDGSDIYRMAMGKCSCFVSFSLTLTVSLPVLHPSFKTQYFTRAGWSDTWVAAAVAITRSHWESRYKVDIGGAPVVASSQVCVHLITYRSSLKRYPS